MMKKILLTAMLAGVAMPAFAADPVYVDPAPVVVAPAAYDWSGIYVGLQAGYLSGNADHSFSNGAPSGDSGPDGFIGGVYAGYNWQFGNTVFGIEGDIEGGDINGSYSNVTGATSVGTSDLNWQASVRARLGYAAGRYLLYVTGGWAYGDFDFGGGPVPLPVAGGYSQSLNGWTVGGGAEAMFTANWIGRIEYRYTDFGTASGTLAPGFPGVTMPVDVDTHAVRVGLAYKF
jgi:outer membrane immunogenic protein